MQDLHREEENAHFGNPQVCCLGHTFSASRMAQNRHKGLPFLGSCLLLQEIYCNFADIVKPFHNLTPKKASLNWTEVVDEAFDTLKQKVVKALILTYPKFHSNASIFERLDFIGSSALSA